MQLISPDVLAEARGLSPGACGFFLFVGSLLWAFGWRWHRFWIVFSITIAAGLIGLSAGRAAGGGQVLAVGILLAVAAGMLAMELSRIVAFFTGGTTAWMLCANLLPAVQELWVVFLCGGLLGVVLYRLWTMLATSFIGLLLSWHTLLVMAEDFAKFDSIKFAADNASAISGALVTVTLLGVFVQNKTGREAEPGKAEGGEEKAEKPEKAEAPKVPGSGTLKKAWKFATS
jgi:hypothetical protein